MNTINANKIKTKPDAVIPEDLRQLYDTAKKTADANFNRGIEHTVVQLIEHIGRLEQEIVELKSAAH